MKMDRNDDFAVPKEGRMYDKLMHRLFGVLGAEKTFRHRHNDRASDWEHSISKAMIDTGHEPLLQTILSTTDDVSTYTEALWSYFKQGKVQSALDLLKAYPDKSHNVGEVQMIDCVVNRAASDEDIKAVAVLLIERESKEYLLRLLYLLQERGRGDLAIEIGEDLLSESENTALALLQAQRNGKLPDNSTIKKALLLLAGEEVESGLVKETLRVFAEKLIESSKDLELCFIVLMGVKKFKFHFSSNAIYRVQRQVINYLCQQERFDEAENFVDMLGSHYVGELNEAKIKQAAQSKNESRHAQLLVEVEQAHQSRIARLVAGRDKSEPFEDEFGLSTGWSYFSRVDLYEEVSTLHAENAIYELMHGSAEKAEFHIAMMMQSVEAIGELGEDRDARRYHEENEPGYKIFLSKLRRRHRRTLKQKFLVLDLLHHLPATMGWNVPVKHPDQELLDYEAKEARREDRQRRNGALNSEMNRAYQIKLNRQDGAIKGQLTKGNTAAAIALVQKHYYKVPDAKDWERAKLVQAAVPEAFAQVFAEMTSDYFRREYGRVSSASDQVMAEFFAQGVVDQQVDKSVWEQLLMGLQQSRMTTNGMYEISGGLLCPLLRELCKVGEVEKAWKVFNKVRKLGNGYYRGSNESIDAQTKLECFAIFMQAADHASPTVQASRAGFLGQDEPVVASDQARLGYWNGRAELMAQNEDEDLQAELCAQLGPLLQTEAHFRTWAKLMKEGTMRNEHQKRNQLLAAYDPKLPSPLRWRMVDFMLDHDLVGVEAMPELKSKETPFKVSKRFFKRLIKKEILHAHTKKYLTKEHMPWLKRLLAEFQNEFNTVMETLEGKNNGGDVWFSSTLELELAPEDWEGVFTILRNFGVFTPGIFAQAKACDYEPVELQKIKAKIEALKAQIFLNEPLGEAVADELLAEIIYAAYKPANLSLGNVRDLCGEIEDCSEHLADFEFEAAGYELDLDTGKTMKLRTGADMPDMVAQLETLRRGTIGNFKEETVTNLLDLARFKFMDDDSVLNLAQLMSMSAEDSEIAETLFGPTQTYESEDDQYHRLRAAQEFFGVFLDDNLTGFLETICSFANTPKISQPVAALAKRLRGKGKAHAMAQMKNLKPEEAAIDWDGFDEMSDAEVVAVVLSAVIRNKFKPLKDFRKQTKEALGAFVSVDGEAAAVDPTVYRAVISKSVGSFFAKSSAGICTNDDVGLFHRKDHFHINIVDETTQVCVGNVQAYLMLREGKKELLLRGFNPSQNMLKTVSPQSFCEAVLAIAKQFAVDNDFDGIILSENGDFIALSNRGAVKKYLESTYGANKVSINDFPIARDGQYKIKKGYRVPLEERTAGC